VAVTTHYEPLKAIATSDARMRNASVGFDVARMAPTFRLRLDVPGASSALAVAERFGLPRAIVERARTIVPEQSKHFDALVKKLEGRLADVEARERALEDELRAAAQARAQAEAELTKQRARDKKALASEAQRVMEQLREARGELDRAKKALRQERLQQGELRALGQRIEELAGAVREPEVEALLHPVQGAPESQEAVRDTLVPGRKVYVPRLRAEAEVLEPPQKGRVRVAAGALRLWVDVADLRELGERPQEPARDKRPLEGPLRPSVRSSDNTLDLRGMRVDDALAMLETFLDRLYGHDERIAFVEHGLGTGALREAVREFLGRTSAYVDSVRPGTPEEGGERLTVVSLR
jgi:DNA mismatch repair protein MutS2